MSSTTEALDLEAIEARANAATPGPWEAETDWDCDDYRTWHFASGIKQPNSPRDSKDFDFDGWVPVEDGEFIAHAREDVPALIAEVKRLIVVAARAREEGAREALATSLRLYEAARAYRADIERQNERNTSADATEATYPLPENLDDALAAFAAALAKQVGS